MFIAPYQDKNLDAWDAFIESSPMGHFLHSRAFLSYHKDRFQDKSLMILDDKEKWVGVFPAAISLQNKNHIISHPGATFGGMIHQGKLTGTKMLKAIALIKNYYQKQDFTKIIYKAVPYFYRASSYADDLYALTAEKAVLSRRDLSSTIDLKSENLLSNKEASKLRNMMKKSAKNDLEISNDSYFLDAFWQMLSSNLETKYGTKPTHSFEEIQMLITKFPEKIKLMCALKNKQVLAGTVLFIDKQVVHTQYLSSTNEGKDFFALDFVIQESIKMSKNEGFHFFDFGISTEKNGTLLNEGLYLSKAKHGASGTIHDFYEITL